MRVKIKELKRILLQQNNNSIKANKEEVWKDVKDPLFKDYYQVSNLGNLKTKGRFIFNRGKDSNSFFFKTPKLVKSRRSKKFPHLFVSLYATPDLKNSTKYIHKLVAEAFIKKPSSKHIFVTHLNGNYEDNTVNNLKWITASENSKNNIEKYPKNKLILKRVNEKNGYYKSITLKIWNKTNLKKIVEMREKGISVKEISASFNCSTASIYSLLKKNKTTKNK